MTLMKKETTEVAKVLGIKVKVLARILVYHPELRPTEQLGRFDQGLWSEDEIEAVRVHYALYNRKHAI
jgi:hypothetical protein